MFAPYPPREASAPHLLEFAGLHPHHRRAYLEGWAHATIGTPAQPSDPNDQAFFNFGSIEARMLTNKDPF